uniref:Transmembrane protein n=1 Tax=Caenorhabditis tropicalis TaxID=1561998 RepID=A0A1I7TL80_9PELO
MNNKLVILLIGVAVLLFGFFFTAAYFDLFVFPGFAFASSQPADQDLKTSRSCIKCVGGKFLEKKWLMQDHRVAQKMAWFEDWTGTDCLEGIVNYYPRCQTSCVTIWIQRKTEVSKAIYDSILMDCADDLISNSPDIPLFKNTTYGIEFRKNEKFYNERSGFKITYEFSTADSKDANLLSSKYKKMVASSGTTLQTPTDDTMLIVSLICVFIILSFLIALCFYVGLLLNRQAKKTNLQARNRMKDCFFNIIGYNQTSQKKSRETATQSADNYEMIDFPTRNTVNSRSVPIEEPIEENTYEISSTLKRKTLERKLMKAISEAAELETGELPNGEAPRVRF